MRSGCIDLLSENCSARIPAKPKSEFIAIDEHVFGYGDASQRALHKGTLKRQVP